MTPNRARVAKIALMEMEPCPSGRNLLAFVGGFCFLHGMSGLWHRALHRFLVRLYFDRVSILGAENLPAGGGAVLLGLHRNGAVDGFVYRVPAPQAVYMISVQLRRSLLGRLFFDGIEVARDKDRGKSPGGAALNTGGMEQCVDLLKRGGSLCIFPEGTSSLGPRHLPFKSGAAHIAFDCLTGPGKPPAVVPMGIHYEAPTEFRSRIEVIIGKPVSTEMPEGWSRVEKLRELKRRFEIALEEVGVNVVSDEYQDTIQRLACIATLGTKRSYFRTLKQLEKSIPAPLEESWKQLSAEFHRPGLLFHQGVPLCPIFPLPLMFAVLAVIGPVTLAGWLLNAPPLLAGGWAGRKFADGPNVITLWRLLVGVPVFILWAAIISLTCALLGRPIWIAVYVVITFAALKLTRLTRKVVIEINNGLRHRDLRERALSFHQQLLSTLPDETI